MPRAPRSCLRASSPGSGPRSRSSTTAGRPSRPEGAEQRVADQRAAGDAGLLETGVEACRAVASRSSSAGAAGWRISTSSWSPISLRAQWMMPMPMKSSAPPRGRPSASVEAPRPPNVSVVADLEGEVGDDEQRSRTRGQPEQGRDLALGALLGRSGRRRSAAARAPAGRGRRSAPASRRALRAVVRAGVARARACQLMPPPSPWSMRVGLRRDPDGEADQARRSRPARRTGPR